MAGQKRWYAPVMRTWRGRVTSRRMAVVGGVCLTLVSVFFAFSGALNPDSGPINSAIRWLVALVWAVLAYMNFAHAVFNAPRDCDERASEA